MLAAVLSVLSTLLCYCLLALFVLWCWLRWRHRRYIRTASKLYTTKIKALPILGHIHYTVFGWERVTEWALEMINDTLSKGLNTMCFWCGPMPFVQVCGLEDIQKILNSSNTAEKGDEMEYIKYAGGNGLLTAPTDIWKITRRHINPLFHPRNMEELTPIFNRNSRELTARLAEHVDGPAFNVMDDTMKIALKSVCHLIFGPEVEFDVKCQKFQGLLTAIEMIPSLFMKRVIRLWLRFDAIFELFYKKELKNINDLWKEFTEIPLKTAKANSAMKKTKVAMLVENSLDEEMESLSKGPLNLLDVYSVLQKNYPQFSENDLKAEMITLYCTGSDTVGAVVSTCLLLLAYYENIQERVYEEISSVVGPDDDVSSKDLDRMPYLDQVFKETLRWSSIVPFILRKPAEDLKLSSCTIPAGNTVIVCLSGLHMDPKTYVNPQKFDPDRFSPDNSSAKERYAFLPFSGGPRSCIGKVYAQILIKMMLIHILRRFKLSTEMDVYRMKRKVIITLVSSEGYNIRIQNRS